jgi:hypothetical protein
MTRSPPAPMFNAEAPALIGSLLRRADSLQLAGEPVWHIHPTLRGLERLPVAVALA